MKKNLFFVLLLLALTALVGISCRSAPAPAPTPTPRPVQQAADPARVRADEARQRAMDFEAPAYFPSEWEELEAQFAASTNATGWSASADGYDELFKKVVPLYAQAREDEILAVREQVINSGFAEIFPQYLKNADDMALAAHALYEAEDYYGAKEGADKALGEYQTLLLGAQILSARNEIVNRGFTQYDPENFLKADEVAQAAVEAFDSGNRETAVASAEEALLRYNLVLSNGWVAYAAERKLAAERERALALGERANIASRETFRAADGFFEQANDLYRAETFNSAALNFIEAEAMFAIARLETEEKRLRAEEAIRLAEEKIEESNEAAAEAERLIEGGAR